MPVQSVNLNCVEGVTAEEKREEPGLSIAQLVLQKEPASQPFCIDWSAPGHARFSTTAACCCSHGWNARGASGSSKMLA